jgi:hypothetical protein
MVLLTQQRKDHPELKLDPHWPPLMSAMEEYKVRNFQIMFIHDPNYMRPLGFDPHHPQSNVSINLATEDLNNLTRYYGPGTTLSKNWLAQPPLPDGRQYGSPLNASDTDYSQNFLSDEQHLAAARVAWCIWRPQNCN